MNTTIDDIMIVTGSGQGLDMISGMLINPGDTVLCEEFCYQGAMNRFRKIGAKIEGMKLDQDGIVIEALEQQLKDLKARGLWNQEMIDNLKYFDGELKDIEAIPADLKAKYLTAFDIDPKWIVDAAARRQKWIDQAQSLNLFLPTPDLKMLSHMYQYAWRTGLKTTYYLRTLGASNIEKATVEKAPKVAVSTASTPASRKALCICSITSGRVRASISLQPSRDGPPKSSGPRFRVWRCVPVAPS